MPSSISVGTTTVSGTVNAVGTFTPSKNTVIGAVGFKAGAGSTTIGTVPAGKIWRIVGLTISGTHATTGLCSIDLNGVVTLQGVNANGGGLGLSVSLSYSDAYVLTAGQIARTTADASGTVTGSIAYIEESV